ncbi:MAG: type III-A CRISPR-associated RAMP protein Csm5 [Thermoplasmata archaeon]|nr:type III-A CRISPR-associated RAMP protein Csm5 [Thermoplasmata archaeon]
MKYKIETLSPIHIGSGEKISPMEYVMDNKFNRIDMDELFRDKEFNVNGFIEDTRLNSFYLGDKYGNIAKRHVMYSLDISKDALDHIMSKKSEILEFIKTGGKPYIPGSSIKGAIRTAIMWYALKNDEELYFEFEEYVNKIWNRKERKPDKKWAGSKIEK